MGTIILSALVAHTGWHWMLERADRLQQFPWPALDAAALAGALRWAMAILILAGVIWLGRVALHHGLQRRRKLPNQEP